MRLDHTSIVSCLLFSCFSVTNNDSFWYLKWICDYLLEFIYIFFYLSIFLVLIPKIDDQKSIGYQEEIDEEGGGGANKTISKDKN